MTPPASTDPATSVFGIFSRRKLAHPDEEHAGRVAIGPEKDLMRISVEGEGGAMWCVDMDPRAMIDLLYDAYVDGARVLLGDTYTPQGIELVWAHRNQALDGKTPAELVKTIEGAQRVYAWAIGLAEGVMG